MTTYHVDVYRDDRWWMIRVPELDGSQGIAEVISQARRYAEIEPQARDLIALVADVAPSTIKLDLHVTARNLDITATAEQIAADRVAAAEAERRVLDESTRAARELKAAGVTLRDIGDIIGVSFQRAGQLVAR
ncbi:HicB family toxin-antitoxin system [Gordonia sp. FQ]|uniref:HicB family toxin-antitoxin system n=1 Tax=Gordonia sp. FQ TaxID=3446634 RepID=UPI003F868CB6